MNKRCDWFEDNTILAPGMIVLLRSASRQDKYGPRDVKSIIHAAANKISFGNKFSKN